MALGAEIMKTSTLLIGGIWLLVVGGNVLNTFTISPEFFQTTQALPWQIVFMPLVVIVGAFITRDFPGERTIGHAVDQRFGSGSYRLFIQSLRPELMFSAMCFCIALSGLARLAIFRTAALPPTVLGFFASGGVAFLAAHYIRRWREAA